MDGEVDEYRFSPYDALNQFREEQYERQLPIPSDLAPPPGLAWNFNVENIPVEPDSGYDPLPSIQRRHLRNLIRRFVDRDADTDFGLQERFYKKDGPGRSGNWSPFELQGAPAAMKTKKPSQYKIVKSIPKNYCDDKMSKINRILIKEHQIQLQFQKSKGDSIDVTYDSPMIIQQEQVSVADQQNDDAKSMASQGINGDDLNQETVPKAVQQIKSEEGQYKPDRESSDISSQSKQNKPEAIAENKPAVIPENRPESISQNRPAVIPENRPEINLQNKAESAPQNQPAIIPENVQENIPQVNPKISPQTKLETVSQNRPQQALVQNKMENVPETQSKSEMISEEKPEAAPQNKPEYVPPNKSERVPQRKPGLVKEEKMETAQMKPQQNKQTVSQARPNLVPQAKNVEEEPEAMAQQQKPLPDYMPYRVQPQAQPKSEALAKAGEGQSEKSEDIPQFFHLLRNKEGNIEQQLQKVQNGNLDYADRQSPKAEEDKAPEALKNVVNRRLNTY